MSKALLALGLLALALLPAFSATMEVYVLVWDVGIDRQTLTARWDGSTLRVDQPGARFAFLYRERDEVFTGLELRDALWWKFSWPALSRTLAQQRETSAALRQNLVTGDDAATLLGNARTPSHEEAPVQIAWTHGAQAGNAWTGTGSPRGVIAVEAQAGAAAPAVAAFWQRFAKAQDILRTVAVRELAPADLLPAVASLPAAAAAPTVLRWTRNGETAETFRLAKVRSDPLDPALFVPSPVSRETKLTTIEGVTD